MLAMRTGALATASAMLIALTASAANAGQISIWNSGDYGSTADGARFMAGSFGEAGTGSPLDPFQRTKTETSGAQNGYNSDASHGDLNFDSRDENGLDYVRSVRIGDLGYVSAGGADHYALFLDANEPISGGTGIDITDLQVYVSSDTSFIDPENHGGYTGTTYDSSDNGIAGIAPVWSLDNATNGDMTITVNAALCDAPGLCETGQGDMTLLIPVAHVGDNPDDYFILYTEYDRASKRGANYVGLEEWRHASSGRHAAPVPEPSSAMVFALGLGVVGSRIRRGCSA